MVEDPLAALRRLEVPEEALSVLAGISVEDQARFVATVESAVAADHQRVESALQATLHVVPAPLRARARALLLGSEQS